MALLTSRHMTNMLPSEAVHSTMLLPCSSRRMIGVRGRQSTCLTIRFRHLPRALRRIIDNICLKTWLLSSPTIVKMSTSITRKRDPMYQTRKHRSQLTLQPWITREALPLHSLMRVIMMSNRTKLKINWVRH